MLYYYLREERVVGFYGMMFALFRINVGKRLLKVKSDMSRDQHDREDGPCTPAIAPFPPLPFPPPPIDKVNIIVILQYS